MKLFPKRESLTLFNEDSQHNETWDHITIYDKDGNVLARTGRNHPESHIELEYDELVYVSHYNKGPIMVTWESLINKFEK